MRSFMTWLALLALLPNCGATSETDLGSKAGEDGTRPAPSTVAPQEPDAGVEGSAPSVDSGVNDDNDESMGADDEPMMTDDEPMVADDEPTDDTSDPEESTTGTPPEVCGPGGCVTSDPAVLPLEPPGPVLCAGLECESNEACCLATGECFDPEANAVACMPPEPDDDHWGRLPCASNAHCGELEYCAADSLDVCQGSGHCNPISNCGECNDGGSGACRVCACDGNTYPNMQTACRAGANVISVTGAGCGETVTTGGGGASGIGQTVTLCANSEQCPAGESCCSITARCYPAAEPELCRLPPAGTTFPCTSNSQCDEHEYCAGEGCSSAGGCMQREVDDCGILFEPVCGCDGRTYTSESCASQSGVRVAATGECAE